MDVSPLEFFYALNCIKVEHFVIARVRNEIQSSAYAWLLKMCAFFLYEQLTVHQQ